jgi:hypothetical protein
MLNSEWLVCAVYVHIVQSCSCQIYGLICLALVSLTTANKSWHSGRILVELVYFGKVFIVLNWRRHFSFVPIVPIVMESVFVCVIS